jgi:hypothetical protein
MDMDRLKPKIIGLSVVRSSIRGEGCIVIGT